MKPFVQWVDEGNFWVRGAYDPITDQEATKGPLKLLQHQRDILGHCLTPIKNEAGVWTVPYTTCIYSCPKKSGKTTIGAAVGSWFTDIAVPSTSSYCIAGDYEHAMGRMFDDILFDSKEPRPKYPNGKLDGMSRKDYLPFEDGKYIQALAQEYKSASGSRHALTLWDELWCLQPGTPVLTQDLKWVAVEDLVVGSKVVSFEDERSGQYRSYEAGTVTATGIEIRPTQRIQLPNNESLVATPNHKWLARRGKHNSIEWIATEDLKVGDLLLRAMPMWTYTEDWETGYLAAAYDGEGCLSQSQGGIRVDFVQKENVMLETVRDLLELKGLRTYDSGRVENDVRAISIAQKHDAIKLLGTLRPERLISNLDWNNMGRVTAYEYVPVQWVGKIKDQEVVTLEVDKGTYISQGFCSHNTYVSETSRRMWIEMTPIKIPGVPFSLRFVATYAGFEGESDLLWDLYNKIVLEGNPVPELRHITHANGNPTCWSNGRMFAYWDSAHRMPWQTEDYYQEQMASGMKPNEYARLHENRWTTGSEPFMPIKWWDNVSVLDKSLEYDVTNPRRNLPVVIGCDASTKHDSTAVVGVQYDYVEDQLSLAFHKIWTPTPAEPMDFEKTLEQYILDRHNEGFQIAAIAYDPTQLHRSMTRLGATISNVMEFPQTLKNMTAASETLYNLFKNQKIWVYADEQLRSHLRYAQAEDKGKGFRIVKPRKAAIHHTDAAVALAIAAYTAYKTHGYDVSQPLRVEIPFADASQWQADQAQKEHEEERLPPQLRSGGLSEEEFDFYWDNFVQR